MLMLQLIAPYKNNLIYLHITINRWLSNFVPDVNYTVELRHAAAERLTKSCEKGYFDNDLWNHLDIS
jgi:hypothetical protein